MTSTAEFIEYCCEVMHDAYERAAVGAGWETQKASRKPWSDVPEANKVTMRAAVGALLVYVDADQPNLGLATTRQLLEEITSRIHTDYSSGGGGLDYTSVHGRPDLPSPE